MTLEDWTGRKTFAEYASFRVESEDDFYRLRVGRYHGNAGDSLTWHNGKQFTTLDKDHDVYTGEWNAVQEEVIITVGGLLESDSIHHTVSTVDPATYCLCHTFL